MTADVTSPYAGAPPSRHAGVLSLVLGIQVALFGGLLLCAAFLRPSA